MVVFGALAFRSDEGLMLETSAFQNFHGGNFTFINSFDKTKFLFCSLLTFVRFSECRLCKFPLDRCFFFVK